MKSLLTFLVLTTTGLIALPTALRAEESKPSAGSADAKPGRAAGAEGRPMLDPAARLKMMTEKLSLTPEQQEKVKVIYAKNADKLKEMRGDKSLAEDAKRQKFMEMRKSEMEEISAILTPEQQEKMKEMAKEMRQRAGGARGERKAAK